MEKDGLIEIENVLLYYKAITVNDDKNPITLVFLHDALGSTAQWKDFPKMLAQKTGLNALIFDRQGYGKSASFSKARTKNYLRDEAERTLPAFLEKLKIDRPVLIGHSDGGTIALLYAAAFEPLAIICEAAHVLVEKETLGGIKKAFGQKDLLIEKLEKYHGGKTEALFHAWHKTWLDPDFQDWNIVEDLKNINCPALIVQGEDDQYATQKHLKMIENGIGDNARAVLIKNCGHIPHLQAKDEVLEKMAEFLKTVL